MANRVMPYFLGVIALVTVLGADARAATLYKSETGPHRVEVADVVVRDDAQPRDIPLRISFPADGKDAPVVVFSHGGGSSKDGYVRVTDHWTSHGYVVIAPTHMDSTSLGFNMASPAPQAMAQASASRLKDLAYIGSHLKEIIMLAPGLAVRADTSRAVIAGHSMGAGSALQAVGMRLKNKRSGSISAMENPGYTAALLLSDPGNNPMMPDAPWLQVRVPTLISTGTNDRGSQSDGSKSPFGNDLDGPAQLENAARHYLWIDGVDHYMGGLWCCEGSKGLPDDEALRVFKAVSTAFLDAYTRGDMRAKEFMSSVDLKPLSGGRAHLERK